MFIICFSILLLFYNFCHKNLHIFALPSSAVLKPAQAGLVFSLIVILYTVRASNKQTHLPYLSFYTHTHTHTLTHTHSLSHTLSLSNAHNNYCQSHDGTELSGVFICDDIAEPIEQLNVSLFTLMPNSFTHCFLVRIIFFSWNNLFLFLFKLLFSIPH